MNSAELRGRLSISAFLRLAERYGVALCISLLGAHNVLLPLSLAVDTLVGHEGRYAHLPGLPDWLRGNENKLMKSVTERLAFVLADVLCVRNQGMLFTWLRADAALVDPEDCAGVVLRLHLLLCTLAANFIYVRRRLSGDLFLRPGKPEAQPPASAILAGSDKVPLLLRYMRAFDLRLTPRSRK
jgi:hypothetical protein